jgi:cell division protein FtsN
VTRPVVRDYKRSRGGRGIELARWREFALGLGIGLGVAIVLFAYQRNAFQKAMAGAAGESAPAPSRRATRGAAGEADTGEDVTAPQYDFYDMLPKFEVVVPEKEAEVRRDAPSTPIERPGVYVLQAGSYRKREDAMRVEKQLSVLGVQASVQRVAVDADEWHRVRIGPLTDLAEVNRLRGRLRGAGLEPLVIRVGD